MFFMAQYYLYFIEIVVFTDNLSKFYILFSWLICNEHIIFSPSFLRNTFLQIV
jgi:hypothetical protein